MNNPFHDISDPEQLRAMVQDGAVCEVCGGEGGCTQHDIGCEPCDPCSGTGRTPLSSPDLDALAACWCEGWERWANFEDKQWFNPEDKSWNTTHPAYTTDPAAAMRLAVKYQVGLDVQGYTHIAAFVLETDINVKCDEDTVGSRCHAWTTAALVAALTEAMEGASE